MKALRLHHIARLKRKRQYNHNVFHEGQWTRPLGQHLATPCPCSCWLCGNPRKYFGNGRDSQTVQELRQNARWKSELAQFQAA